MVRPTHGHSDLNINISFLSSAILFFIMFKELNKMFLLYLTNFTIFSSTFYYTNIVFL